MQLELTGLRADLPIGAMAAFGCLRLCANAGDRIHAPRLHWRRHGGTYIAVLSTANDLAPDSLITLLKENVAAAANRPELTWEAAIKSAKVERFREAAREVLASASRDNREAPDWFAAFGSDLVLNQNGQIEPTPFDMSVARQRFLADAVKLAGTLANPPKRNASTDPWREALFGPWRYADDQHSLGWDPSTLKLGAFTWMDPSPMKNRGVQGAVWLAFQSLPLFPCLYDGGLAARGFRRERRFTLTWPVWNAPISVAALQSLLSNPLLTSAALSPKNISELRARGVAALYRSERFKPNKYLASFRPPELVFGEEAAAMAR